MEKYTNKLLKYNPHNAKIMVQNKAKKKKTDCSYKKNIPNAPSLV